LNDAKEFYMHEIGKPLMVIGIVLFVAGAAVFFAHKVPGLGRLPGDIVIQKKNVTIFFPLATSILVSAILSLIFWLWSRR
jgi:hypothetical protein